MAGADEISVEVAYAGPEGQTVRTLVLVRGSTVAAAIRASDLLETYPEISLEPERVGVFGEPVGLDAVLQGGERVEIYRPLVADPREARHRRVRAKKKKSG